MIVSEFTNFWKNFERYFGQRKFLEKCRIFLDCCGEYRRSMTTCERYGLLRFDQLSRSERAKYVSLGRLLKFSNDVNDPVMSAMVFDKLSFHCVFAEFTERKFLNMRTANRESVAAFAEKNPRVFVKPRNGTCGVGCSIEDCSTDDARAAFLAKYGGSNLVAEELIAQHANLATLNPLSINPIRITTFLCRDGRVEFPVGFASVRVGVDGSPAVNCARGAINAPVDLKTGRVVGEAFDTFGGSMARHPVSGVPFIGHQVPCWSKVVDTAAKLAHVVPEVPFVGWDLTVNEAGRVVAIEGNTIPDITFPQIWTGGLQDRLDALRIQCRENHA